MMGRAPHKRALDRDTAEDYQIMRQSLKAVGMQEFEERSFSTLSGGEQQRIILARALAQQTPVSYTHLDVYKRQNQESSKKAPTTTMFCPEASYTPIRLS